MAAAETWVGSEVAPVGDYVSELQHAGLRMWGSAEDSDGQGFFPCIAA